VTAEVHDATERQGIEPVTIDGWTFRVGEEADEPQILEIFGRSFDRFPPWPIQGNPRDFIHWYGEGYEPGTGGLFVAAEGDRVVCATLAFGRPLVLKGRTVSGAQGGFIAVNPEDRRRGVVRTFMQWATEQNLVDVSWGFTQVEALVKMRRRDGSIEPANRLTVYARILNPLKAAGDRADSSLKYLGPYAAVAVQGWLASRSFRTRRDWAIGVDVPFDERITPFFERAATAFDFIPFRSATYLNWRYRDGRAGGFITLVAEQAGAVLGYATIRIIKSRAHLADLLVLPGRNDVAASLIEQAVRVSRLRGASAVECTMPTSHPYTGVLKRAGFVRLAARSEVLANKFAVRAYKLDPAELEFLSDPAARIHIVEGDSDMI